MLASSGTRNSPNASNIEGRLGSNLFLEETSANSGVICLLCRQFARASAQKPGTCRAKPQPLPSHSPYPQHNHSLTSHSIVRNASAAHFLSIGAVRHTINCILMRRQCTQDREELRNFVNALFQFSAV